MSISKSEKITKCLISGGSVEKALDFGQHSYADRARPAGS